MSSVSLTFIIESGRLIFEGGSFIMEPNNQEVAPSSAPIVPEVEKSKELLNKDKAGFQAAILRDGFKWAPGVTISKQDLQDVQTKIKENSFKTEKITKGSNLERDEFWNGENSEYKGKSFREQMGAWRDGTKKFIGGCSPEEQEILKKLGWEADKVDEGYKEYFGHEKDGGHKGDVVYFAKKVAETLRREEIKKYTETGLLEKIGGFYGKDSATVARILAEGVKNLEGETFDEFSEEAVDQFNKGLSTMEVDFIDKIHERSDRWDGKQKQEEAEEKQRQEAKEKAAAERLAKENEKKKLGLDVGEKSIVSEDHPGRNEDTTLLLKEKGVFGLFDGLSGNSQGDTASKLTKDSLEKYINEYKGELTEGGVKDAITKAFAEANKAVLDKAKEKKDIYNASAAIGYVIEEKDGRKKAVIASVGNSRVYVLTKDGNLKQITLDNNIRNKYKDEDEARLIQRKLNNIGTQLEFNTLQKDERELFEGRNSITQAIGSKEEVSPNIYTQDLQEGDKLIFLTDGISGNLTVKEIGKIISESKNSQEATDRLTEAASKRSKEDNHIRHIKDDMSALVVGISELPTSSSTTPEKPNDPMVQKTEEIKSEEKIVQVPITDVEAQLKEGSSIVKIKIEGKPEGYGDGWKFEKIDKEHKIVTLKKTINGEEVSEAVSYDQIISRDKKIVNELGGWKIGDKYDQYDIIEFDVEDNIAILREISDGVESKDRIPIDKLKK